MHRLRFSHETLGDRAEQYGPGFANVYLPKLQQGSAAYYR
jgi:hypothetical protein